MYHSIKECNVIVFFSIAWRWHFWNILKKTTKGFLISKIKTKCIYSELLLSFASHEYQRQKEYVSFIVKGMFEYWLHSEMNRQLKCARYCYVSRVSPYWGNVSYMFCTGILLYHCRKTAKQNYYECTIFQEKSCNGTITTKPFLYGGWKYAI